MLDLGCGNGKMAEYISDCTGANLTGIDFIPFAIQQAQERTQAKRDRLEFKAEGNLMLSYNLILRSYVAALVARVRYALS